MTSPTLRLPAACALNPWSRPTTDASKLSPVEVEVLRLIAGGLSDQEIAGALCKSLNTFRTHRDHLLSQTGCHNRVELTRYAVAAGYVRLDWPSARNRANA